MIWLINEAMYTMNKLPNKKKITRKLHSHFELGKPIRFNCCDELKYSAADNVVCKINATSQIYSFRVII